MTYSLRGKTYWLVGASAGIGAALAQELDRRGADLVLSARSESGLNVVADTLSRPARIFPLDVTDVSSIVREGTPVSAVDGVIYIAGDYSPMTAMEWDVERARQISAINYVGALNVLGEVVPEFIRKDRGHIVVIGSLAGFCGLPGAISYGSSKAAVMHLAKDIRTDLAHTGVRVQCINPGFVETRLTEKNDFQMPFIMTAQKAAEKIASHMETRRYSTSFPRLFSWYFKIKAIGEILRS